jgi:hypothetical protein
MNLYIETKDGYCVNHPAFEDNLLQAFGSIPEHWEPFVRIERPIPSIYEILESDEPVYAKVDGTWTDVWSLRPMTDAEKAAKQQAVKDAFNTREQAENWSAWVFDEATCTMQPPIPKPAPDRAKLDQRIATFWCGADNNWKDTLFVQMTKNNTNLIFLLGNG